MSYGDDEASAQDSEPRELITISINDGVQFYRHTSASRDINYGGFTFTSLAMDREPVALTRAEDEEESAILLPIDHPLARRWTVQASPPFKAEVTIQRRQERSGEIETIWNGEIKSMSVEGGVAKFRVPARSGQWQLRPIASFAVTDSCVHLLFDANCGVLTSGSSPGGVPHKLSAVTVLAVNGRDVKVTLGSGTEHNGTWAQGGKLVHTSSQEPRAILLQTDVDPGVTGTAWLRMRQPIPDLKVGDSVDIYVGCPKTIAACVAQFDNRQAHLSWALKPEIDYFDPVKGGVKQ